jgi:hypothetical protein
MNWKKISRVFIFIFTVVSFLGIYVSDADAAGKKRGPDRAQVKENQACDAVKIMMRSKEIPRKIDWDYKIETKILSPGEPVLDMARVLETRFDYYFVAGGDKGVEEIVLLITDFKGNRLTDPVSERGAFIKWTPPENGVYNIYVGASDPDVERNSCVAFRLGYVKRK